MKLLLLLLTLVSCASNQNANNMASDVRSVDTVMAPFDPPRKLVGMEAQQIFEATVSEGEESNQSEFTGECVFAQTAQSKRPLSFTIGDEAVEDGKLVSVLCRHAWHNYTAIESPDYDDEDGAGMVAPLHMQCERIKELNRPLTYECEFMQLKAN